MTREASIKSKAISTARWSVSAASAGKADQLNAYYYRTGMPDYFEEDLARYRALNADDIRSAVVRYLPKDTRAEPRSCRRRSNDLERTRPSGSWDSPLRGS